MHFELESAKFESHHYAFKVTEQEFNEIFSRLEAENIKYGSSPYESENMKINHDNDGRGVYFDDPNGHLLEIITRPYGSGGVAASHPHPLLAT